MAALIQIFDTDDETNQPTCVDGGNLGAICRLGCRAGFEMSDAVDGQCELTGNGTTAEYVGQGVVCAPEIDENGHFTEGYCSMASTEAVLDCCEGLPPDSPEAADCGEDNHPGTCSVECAERWQPLKEGCEAHLADYTALTAACDTTALQFLGNAPSAIQVSGALCHPEVNGLYHLQNDTIGVKTPAISHDGPLFPPRASQFQRTHRTLRVFSGETALEAADGRGNRGALPSLQRLSQQLGLRPADTRYAQFRDALSADRQLRRQPAMGDEDLARRVWGCRKHSD